MGRRSMISAQLVEDIARSLRAGCTVADTCLIAGISQATFCNWRNRGELELERVNGDGRRGIRKSERLFVEFFEATTRARGVGRQTWLKKIEQAADKDWRAAAWLLEHTADGYAKTQRVEVTGADGGPVRHSLEDEREIMIALSSDPETFQALAIVTNRATELALAAETEEDEE